MTVVRTGVGPIEYATHGTGDPCLVLHGGHGSCRDGFGVDEVVASGHRAIVPSRPGYGLTPAAAGRTASEAADAMAALLDALSIEQASVVAVSAGGPTALHLAARHPARVRRLVLEAAASRRWLLPTDRTYRQARRLFRPSVERYTWASMRALSRAAPSLMLRSLVPSLSTRKTGEVLRGLSPTEVTALRRMVSQQRSGEGFLLDLEHEVEPEVLGSITAPTLVVHSRSDNAVPVEHAEHAAAHIPTAELVLVDTWGHLVWLGDGSDEVRTRATGFLRDG